MRFKRYSRSFRSRSRFTRSRSRSRRRGYYGRKPRSTRRLIGGRF